MGRAKIAFNSTTKPSETFRVYVDNGNGSVMIDVCPGMNMRLFAPVAVGLAKFYKDKKVFIDLGSGDQLPVFKNDTSEKFLNRFLAASPFGKPAKKYKGPCS